MLAGLPGRAKHLLGAPMRAPASRLRATRPSSSGPEASPGPAVPRPTTTTAADTHREINLTRVGIVATLIAALLSIATVAVRLFGQRAVATSPHLLTGLVFLLIVAYLIPSSRPPCKVIRSVGSCSSSTTHRNPRALTISQVCRPCGACPRSSTGCSENPDAGVPWPSPPSVNVGPVPRSTSSKNCVDCPGFTATSAPGSGPRRSGTRSQTMSMRSSLTSSIAARRDGPSGGAKSSTSGRPHVTWTKRISSPPIDGS